MRFQIDWASLLVGGKFNIFVAFTLYLRQFIKYKPPGGLYLEGLFNGGIFALSGALGRLCLEGLMPGGPYLGNFTISRA